ncbi:pyridoxal phosphate-dependent transferase [Tribonema minus]|uniref:Glutamate decarboxylase n=1 Tax=Tribonema minus TaxID=303371 RepID=A0A835Z100_9STRA|nr:pyridoxal phosphate-dependent transferase [Tribonema minus]
MVLDGRPRLNLASFVTTRMEPEAEALMQDAATKNAIDMDEYPQTTIMHQRCVNMIGRLFHAPLEPEQEATGTGAIGSSEAIMLAVLAMKWAWKAHRAKKGLPATNPNIVFGSNVQVCWHKACVYFEIEGREGKVSADKLVLTPERAEPLIDENTIGVCCLLGSTFNGEYEDIKGIHDMVVAKNEANDWMVRIHVDAASGGFVAPFLEPDLLWDFRLPNVKSINVSGHKFGLVYAGIGWLLFREKADLHPDLVFHVNYLGGDQASFTLNFSKGAGTIVGQYYQLLRLGKVGYTQIMTNAMSNAQFLRQKLVATGKVDIRDKGNIPLVAWSLKDSSKYTVFDIQDKLRDKNWIVPAYTCPPGAEELAILRVVVKQDFSRDLAETLVDDIVTAMDWLEHHPSQHAAVQGEINEKREAKHAKHTTKLKDVANRIKWAMHVVPSTSLPEDSEHGAAPLLSKHHLFSMKTDPKHRSTGEKTFGVC